MILNIRSKITVIKDSNKIIKDSNLMLTINTRIMNFKDQYSHHNHQNPSPLSGEEGTDTMPFSSLSTIPFLTKSVRISAAA